MLEAKRLDVTPDVSGFPIPTEYVATIFSPKTLATIGVSNFQRLTAHFSPTVLYPLISHLTEADHMQLEDILRNVVGIDIDQSFLMATAGVCVLMSENNITFLEEQGLTTDDSEPINSFAVRAVIEHPFQAQKAIARVYERGFNFGVTSYSLFRSKRPLNQIQALLRRVNSEGLRENCAAYFAKKKYSKYAKVLLNTVGKWGFAIDRGGYERGHATLDSNLERKNRIERPVKTDHALFDESTNALWVHARSPKDRRFYAEAVGHIAGDQKLFFELETFNLTEVLDRKFIPLLQDAATGEINRITLRSVKRYVAGNKQDTRYQSARGRQDCLTDQEYFFNGTKSDVVVEIKLRIYFKSEHQLFGDLTVKEGQIVISEHVTAQQATKVLASLGIFEGHTNV